MGILGLIFTDTIINTLRGESKVRIINQVKQNGQVVLDKLSNEIRQADRVVCIGKTASGTIDGDTIVISKGGYYYRYRLQGPLTGSNSRNGYISVESFVVTTYDSDITRDSGTDEDNYCTDSSSYKAISLTDQDLRTGVSLNFDGSDAAFSFGYNTNYKDTVIIRFKASESVRAGENYENQVEVLFTTTIQVRGRR